MFHLLIRKLHSAHPHDNHYWRITDITYTATVLIEGFSNYTIV